MLVQIIHHYKYHPKVNRYIFHSISFPKNITFFKNAYKQITAENAVLFIHSLSLREIIDPEIAQNVEILWSEPALKAVYEERAILHIDDSINYFLDDIQRIGSFREDYIPTDMDIINVRHRTTGVTSKTFIIEQNGFSLFDVGGQQSERKKWIHCFEDVTAVIFVASLSCYDESVFENREKNAMHDTLELFDEICNNKWFTDTPIILFLNKNDLFKEKILKNVSLSVCFDDFKEIEDDEDGYSSGSGGNNSSNVENESYLKCLQFIKDKFQEKNYINSGKRVVHMHVTTATDTSNVQYVFHSVQALVISQCLQTLI